MEKYGAPEKINVVEKKEATVLSNHMKKVGKTDLGTYTEEERQELEKELEKVSESNLTEK